MFSFSQLLRSAEDQYTRSSRFALVFGFKYYVSQMRCLLLVRPADAHVHVHSSQVGDHTHIYSTALKVTFPLPKGLSLLVRCNSALDSLARLQAAAEAPPDSNVELKYFSQRMSDITKHFPSAINMDDFLARVEVALCAHGFRGDNSITCTNLCRDESTGILKTEIDDIFGASFNINGLGACLTCGQLGTFPARILPYWADRTNPESWSPRWFTPA